MDKLYHETYLKLETAIQELEIESDCPIKRIEAVIQLVIQSLSDLKKFVLKNDFKNTECTSSNKKLIYNEVSEVSEVY